MTMTNFINKWAKKAIKEYKESDNLETLENEHFLLCFNQGETMFNEMNKVELADKYRKLDEDEVKEMLTEMIQEKIDAILGV